jgi:hypothetical protein
MCMHADVGVTVQDAMAQPEWIPEAPQNQERSLPAPAAESALAPNSPQLASAASGGSGAVRAVAAALACGFLLY